MAPFFPTPNVHELHQAIGCTTVQELYSVRQYPKVHLRGITKQSNEVHCVIYNALSIGSSYVDSKL